MAAAGAAKVKSKLKLRPMLPRCVCIRMRHGLHSLGRNVDYSLGPIDLLVSAKEMDREREGKIVL